MHFLVSGLAEMVMESASSPGPFRNALMSKAAQTHKLRKLRAPSKCRECDGLVVFQGAECEEVRSSSSTPTSILFTLFIRACCHSLISFYIVLFGLS